MYAFIAGELIDPGPPTVLAVGGVGYELQLPQRGRERLPRVGERVRLYTHFQVREDEHTLYGFLDPQERTVFRSLLGVSGVGPKVALAIVGDPIAESILRGIAAGDVAALLKVKGVGRRTAERIVLELKDRALPWMAGLPGRPVDETDDATLALIGLGLSPEKARALLAQIPAEERAKKGVEEVVRLALKQSQAQA
ncbi:MAG TPA: Holliday junction branch migration protein RuvA [Candidatus Krumholzibacteria bacterium]